MEIGNLKIDNGYTKILANHTNHSKFRLSSAISHSPFSILH